MNLVLLNRYIAETGIPRTVISERIGMPYSTFLQKCSGRQPWKVEEAKRFSEVMNLTKRQREAIFF